jgi:hypothetical protein
MGVLEWKGPWFARGSSRLLPSSFTSYGRHVIYLNVVDCDGKEHWLLNSIRPSSRAIDR